ncbi:TIGR00282 family metallophosphoesterase [Mycoplasmopsis gallinacea]|nr:TIGR00282 family metallophosphoesterase [Mycoplasmopsis gallinacea]
MKKLNVLFIGDIFGEPGVVTVEKVLPKIIKENNIDFVIAQGENVTGRKGLDNQDYLRLKNIGVNAITMGNHVWANPDIYNFIENSDVIRPLNIPIDYPGVGSKTFDVKGFKLQVISLMGITFNTLMSPWNEEEALNFFDSIDILLDSIENVDFRFVDFHAETTSEKNVLGLYLDGKVNAVCGTHTHVQTNDYRTLPNGTAYISDAGMCGPQNAAIGANYEQVYKKMRYGSKEKFEVSPNNTQFNAVIIEMSENKNKISPIRIDDIKF